MPLFSIQLSFKLYSYWNKRASCGSGDGWCDAIRTNQFWAWVYNGWTTKEKRNGKSNSALKRKASCRSRAKSSDELRDVRKPADVLIFLRRPILWAVRLAKIFDGDTITIVAAAGKRSRSCVNWKLPTISGYRRWVQTQRC
jgi:hypothetical protein